LLADLLLKLRLLWITDPSIEGIADLLKAIHDSAHVQQIRSIHRGLRGGFTVGLKDDKGYGLRRFRFALRPFLTSPAAFDLFGSLRLRE